MSNRKKLPKNLEKLSPDDFMLIPLLESLKLGVNNFAPSNIADYIKIYHPTKFDKSHSLFAVKCKDNNLEPQIFKNDIMIIHPQQTAKFGDIVAFKTPYSITFGKVIDVGHVGFANKKLKYFPGAKVDLGIVGRVISVHRIF